MVVVQEKKREKSCSMIATRLMLESAERNTRLVTKARRADQMFVTRKKCSVIQSAERNTRLVAKAQTLTGRGWAAVCGCIE